LTARATDLLKSGGFDVHATVVDGGISRRHVEDGLFISTNGQWVVLAQRARGADPQIVGNGNHSIEADFVLQLNGNGVQRILEGVGNGDFPEVFVAEVFGAVAVPAAGGVEEDVIGFDAGINGRGVGEQLERGAWRAQSLGGSVELTAEEIFSAHHHPHQTCSGLERHDRALTGARRKLPHNLLSPFLPFQIEAGADFQTTHFQLLRGEHLGQFLGHPTGEVWGCAIEIFGNRRFEIEWRFLGGFGLAGCDESGLKHALQHD